MLVGVFRNYLALSAEVELIQTYVTKVLSQNMYSEKLHTCIPNCIHNNIHSSVNNGIK